MNGLRPDSLRRLVAVTLVAATGLALAQGAAPPPPPPKLEPLPEIPPPPELAQDPDLAPQITIRRTEEIRSRKRGSTAS
jgi:hypothetical protein